MSIPLPDQPPPARRRRLVFRSVLLLGLAAVALSGWRWYRSTRPDYRLARGEEAIRAQDWSTAAREIDRLVAAGATDHAAFLRGEYFRATGRPDLGLSAFTEVSPDGRFRVPALVGAGRCLIALGDLQGAHRSFTAAVAAGPDDADAHRGLAAVAYDLGQLQFAVHHLEVAARLDPADPRPHRLVGLIQKDLGQHEPAEAAYREALRRGLTEPARGEMVVELADTLVRAGKFADALAVLDDDPPAPGPACAAARVEALRGVGRRADAAAAADRAIAVHPSDGRLRRLRGQLHLDDGNPIAAVGTLEAAAARLPADYQTQFLLAQAYYATNRPADAAAATARSEELRRTLERANALTREAMERPWDAQVRLELAKVSEVLGDAKLAAMWRAAAEACRPR